VEAFPGRTQRAIDFELCSPLLSRTKKEFGIRDPERLWGFENGALLLNNGAGYGSSIAPPNSQSIVRHCGLHPLPNIEVGWLQFRAFLELRGKDHIPDAN
jgi:hypothetical protein